MGWNGQGGIRTHETREGPPVFKTGSFNHSDTCPKYHNFVITSTNLPMKMCLAFVPLASPSGSCDASLEKGFGVQKEVTESSRGIYARMQRRFW
jgi:hypothetical protein